jgi:hypothetical protein
MTLPIRADLGPDRAPAEADDGSVPFLERFTEGIDAVRISGSAAALVLIWTSSNLLYGQETVLYALTASRLLGTGTDGVAFLYAAIGVGGIAVAAFASRAADHPKQGTALTVAAFGCGLPIFCLAFVREPWIAYVLLAGEGAAMIVLDVLVVTSLQRLLGNEVLGRAFGAIDAIVVAAILLGMLIAPLTVRLTSLQGGLAIAGIITFAAAAAFLPKARAIDRAASARAETLAPLVGVLETLEIFEGAPRATLEGLAEVAVPVRVGPGATVLRQGDPPDDLYVVVTGALEASVRDEAGERVVGSIGEGEYFGEIGLLRNVPRTATVTATVACDLLRIPGDRFLAIVTGEATRVMTLSRTVQARLAAHRRPAPRVDTARPDTDPTGSTQG